MTEIRILTVRQPWAWAIMFGGKDVENRVRNIAGDYRGTIAIHAGLQWDSEAWRSYELLKMTTTARELDYGKILGTVELVGVHSPDACRDRAMRHLERLYHEDRPEFDARPDSGAGGLAGKIRPCSPWAEDGSYHLELADPRPLETPILWTGSLGLRKFDSTVLSVLV